MTDADPSPQARATARPLRVLYLNPFSQQVSGPDESLLTLLGGLIPLGVEPHVVLPRPGPQVSRYEALGARVHYAPLTFLRRRLGPKGLALLAPRLVRSVLAVIRIARRERIDLIHTNMEVVLDGAFAARLLRIPHVLHYRGNTLDRPKLAFDLLTRFWTATADKVLCISNATAEIFRKRGLGGKVEVLYNPVDVDAFANAERSDAVRAELGAAPGDLLIGTVGRIHPRKGMETFLRAGAIVAASRPGVRLTVVGAAEVPEEITHLGALRDLVRDLQLEDRVYWAGARRDMPRVFKALDVFVLASRNEGFGRVVAEAKAAGLPTVLSNEGAFPELAALLPGTRLSAPSDPTSFAGAIISVSTGPSLARRHTEADAFRASRIARRLRSVYMTCTGGTDSSSHTTFAGTQ
jgi:glycosyltransferase involved in cell wall biosynthesis